MPKKWGKKFFLCLIIISLLLTYPHFNFLCVLETYALPTQVSVKGTTVNVRSGPGTTYKILGTVALGYKIFPISSEKDKSGNGKTWYKFLYDGKDAYVRSDLVKEMASYEYDATFEAELNMKGFPESYKPGLRDLHTNYPNWVFSIHKTGLDFNYVVSEELKGTKTLVLANSISSYKSVDEGKYDYTTSKWPTFDGGAWVCASKEVTMCYLDPRNFLYSPFIFQFELQTFNQNIHTIDGIKEMVKGTFLDAKVKTEGLSINNSSNVINSIPTSPLDSITSILPKDVNSSNIGPGVEIAPLSPNAVITPILFNDNEVYAFSNVYTVPGGPGTNAELIEALGPGAGLVQSNTYESKVIGPGGEITETETSFPYQYLPAGTYTYAELIYDACRQVNANPYVIVSMILQEQGKNGSDSVSGTNKKYKNAYNYGNINSFANNGLTAIESGLKYALTEGSYNRPWNTKEKGIYGLCEFYANSYVKDGQDTFYLKKWNVQGANLFKHQYMTNVAGGASEGQILGNAYDEKMLQMPHEFKIPVFNNMPETNCPMPTKDGSPNNKLKSLSVTNHTLTPSFDTNTSDYTLIVENEVDEVFVNAEAYDKKAAVGGIGKIFTITTYTNVIIYVVSERGDIRQYNINIYKRGAENKEPQNYSTEVPIIIGSGINNNINGGGNISSNVINNVENYGPGMSQGNINTTSGLNVQVGIGPGM